MPMLIKWIDDAAVALATSPAFEELRDLDLEDNRIGDEGALALARSPDNGSRTCARGQRVTILEAQDRRGGRVYSVPIQEFGYPVAPPGTRA
jgi:hypothetical protein